MSRMRLRLLLMIAIVCMAAWLLCPLPGPSAIKTDVVNRQGLPSSTVHDVRFACTRTSDRIEIDVSPSLSQGRLEISVLDTAGQVLAGPWNVTADRDDNLTLVTDGGFTPSQTLQLRCREHDLLGLYRLSISQPRVVVVSQRYFAGLVALAAGWLVTVVLGWLGIGGKRVLLLRGVFGGFAFLASPLLVYAVLHEGGHILALVLMGAWDPSGTSLFPVNGQLPHAAAAPSAHLSSFDSAIAAVAGPLLPTLLAYGAFAVWRTQAGRRWRKKRLQADIRWSFLTAAMLLPQAIQTAVFFALPGEGDFSIFVENVGLPLWVSDAGLAIIAVVNAVLSVWITRHIIVRVRGTPRDTVQHEDAPSTVAG